MAPFGTGFSGTLRSHLSIGLEPSGVSIRECEIAIQIEALLASYKAETAAPVPSFRDRYFTGVTRRKNSLPDCVRAGHPLKDSES
jgi:hypothetical protein